MRYFLVVLLSSLLFQGCALFYVHTDEYKAVVDEAQKVADALDKNVERLGSNNVALLANDTQRLVDAGEMTAEARKQILDRAMEQAVTTKKQAVFIKDFADLAHKDANDVDLSEAIAALMSSVNEIVPEVEKFVDNIENLCKN